MVAAGAIAWFAPPADALINLYFTPVDLARQSEMILRLEVSPPTDHGQLPAAVISQLKGEAPRDLTLAANLTSEKVATRLKREFAGGGKQTVLLFAGDFSEAVDEGPGEDDTPIGALYVGTSWFALIKGGGGFVLSEDKFELHTVWAGSEEMLSEATQYILADRRADVPTRPGVAWGQATLIGQLDGPIREVKTIDFDGDGRPCVWVSDAGGDRFFRLNEDRGECEDVTAEIAASQEAAAWLDRLRERAKRVSQAGSEVAPHGKNIEADFDNDGVADVLRAHPQGLLFFRRGEDGSYVSPVEACEFALGEGITAMLPGDYDADRDVDLVIGGAGGCFVFANLGDGRFLPVLRESGEVSYNAKPNVADAFTFDVNNDGRQEFMLLYRDMDAMPFFNRGFRTFGFAFDLEMKRAKFEAAQALAAGQTAGTAADIDGDGAQDLVLADAENRLWLIRRDDKGSRLGATVFLPRGKVGPVNVTAFDGNRCLGTRVVTATAPALFGKQIKGPIDLAWRRPGGEEVKKRIIVLGPTRFVAPAAGE